MPGYIIVEVDVQNPAEYENYKLMTPISLAAYQGKFIGEAEKQKHWRAIGIPRELWF